MSAINTQSEVSAGVSRHHTQCKIRFDSHNAGSGSSSGQPIWVMDAVVAVQTSKTIKAAGAASITLTPSHNWLNLLFPNDYVNIYFNIGDGEGWTRTFFGMIDRVEETYQVAKDGKPQTRFHVVCSDFQKVFERTMIYFNPHLKTRPDLIDSDFAAPNIGGLALATKGITLGGTPADIVQNFILVTLGFGSQWVLPPTYTAHNQNRLKRQRVELIQGSLNDTAKKLLEQAGGDFEKLKQQLKAKAKETIEGDFIPGSPNSLEDRIAKLAKDANLSTKDAAAVIENDKLAEVLADQTLKSIFNPTDGEVGSQGAGAINVLEGTTKDRASLLDIVDIVTFVERRAIDGYLSGKPVWQSEGSLLSIIRQLAHEVMNEVFFDLRPMSIDTVSEAANYGFSVDNPSMNQYARAEDDVLGNLPEKEHPMGVMYTPALVMREHPFSTIDGLNLNDVSLKLKDKAGDNVKVGIIHFGSIFSDNPNTPGRHIVAIPNINIVDRAIGGDSNEFDVPKHLDVAVVKEQEIFRSTFGRSDSEHFNLVEFTSRSLLGEAAKLYMHDILPIVTPIHVMQHGLRVRSVSTLFANFDAAVTKKTNSTLSQEDVDENTSDPTNVDDLEDPVPAGSIIPPVTRADDAGYNNSSTSARHGYRLKTGIVTPPGTSGSGGSWVFHQGIDIYAVNSQDTAAAHDIPIRCIADGYVMLSCPENIFSGYGNLVVVKHNFEGVGVRYSVYSHLSRRSVGWGDLSIQNDVKSNRRFYAAKGAPGADRTTQEPIKIRKGDLIGYMGTTGTSRSPNLASNKSGAGKKDIYKKTHLHFEIDTVFPPGQRSREVKGLPVETPRIPVGTGPGFSATRPATPTGYDRSIDPVLFYQEVHGIDLESVINQGSPATSTEDYDGDDEDRGDPPVDSDENLPQDSTLEKNNKEALPGRADPPNLAGRVDNPMTRSQILRWALLQDHWYQHNLEYLSGRIDMRGAPEIRVGYRLDLEERRMSAYITGVNHSWTFPNHMQTSLTVTRGQPNNPFPHYVMPPLDVYNAVTNQRKTAKSRLATYYITPDTIAVRRASVLKGKSGIQSVDINSPLTTTQSLDYTVNQIDNTVQDENGIDEQYNEHVIPASSVEAAAAVEEQVTLEELDEALKAFDEAQSSREPATIQLDTVVITKDQ